MFGTGNCIKLFFAPFDPDPDRPGHHVYRGPTDIPDDLDWASLDRLCPVLDYSEPITPDLIERSRAVLKRGLAMPFPDQFEVRIGHLIQDALRIRCSELGPAAGGCLYVLEFQGPVQYVMYGQTTRVDRRVATHRRDARRHGFGLLNAWASPPLPDARLQERWALDLAESLHGAQHRNECFYEMPFDKALTVARVAAETALRAAEEEAPVP